MLALMQVLRDRKAHGTLAQTSFHCNSCRIFCGQLWHISSRSCRHWRTVIRGNETSVGSREQFGLWARIRFCKIADIRRGPPVRKQLGCFAPARN